MLIFSAVLRNILLFLFAVVPLGVAFFFNNKVEKLGQKRKDDFVDNLFHEATSGNIENFALFLRPFYITGKIRESVHNTYTTAGAFYARPVKYQLEKTIIEAFEELMPIVALGKPGEVRGVGRILVDENDWKVAASKLMKLSLLIFCVPSGHKGTKWELDKIIHNEYLTKTVFLMPPDPSDARQNIFRHKWRTMRNDWNTAVAYMKSHDITIPDYQKGGLLFSVKPMIGCFIEELSLASSKSLQKAILRLSRPLPSSELWEQRTARQTLWARAIASIRRVAG